MEAKFLEKEQLDKFNAARTNYFDVKSQIAEIAISEEQLKVRKAQTFANFDVAHSELMEVQNEIHTQYGECKIDFTTGEILDVNP